MHFSNTSYHKLVSFLRLPLKQLSQGRWQMKVTVGLILFCSLFLTFFVPFNITAWLTPFTFLPVSSIASLCIGGGAALTLSHTAFYLISRKVSPMRVCHLLLSCILDITFLSFVLAYLFRSYPDSYLTDLYETFQLVAPVLLLAYLLLGLALAVYQLREARYVSGSVEPDTIPEEMVCFYDTNGELRFRLFLDDVLYIEAADNYVSVYFMKNGRLSKELLRNTLKNTEKNLSGKGFQKCHRSYLVNTRKVTGWKKSGRNYLLLFGAACQSVPVSRLYIPQFIKDEPFTPKLTRLPQENTD